MIISGILSILGSSAVGSLIGGFFAMASKKQDTVLELKRMDVELAMRDKDIELARVESQGQMFVASEATEAARFVAIAATAEADKLDSETLKQAGWMRFLFVIAEAYRKLMRPGITTALLAGALWANWMVFSYLGASWETMESQQRLDLLLQAFGWVSGQASAAISYWMVSRGATK